MPGGGRLRRARASYRLTSWSHHGTRIPGRVFRREDQVLLLALDTATDRVRREVLDCWLRVMGTGDERRVRIGLGLNGDDLFPTEAEAERAEKERLAARVRELEKRLRGG